LAAQAQSAGLKAFLDEVASASPAPGGGSVSAVAGSLAAALGAMVCRLTLGKKQYADVQDRIGDLLQQCDQLKEELYELVQKDADSFDAVMAAMKLPKQTDEQKAKRNEEIQKATIVATETPLAVMKKSLQAIGLAREIAEIGNVNSVSDAGVGAIMGRTAVEGAYFNVMINLPGIEDKSVADRLRHEAEEILEAAEESAKQARQIVVEKIG
jgi:glutamate formiminotransferase/formiminotetrahydrofolate cyclodeaminase